MTLDSDNKDSGDDDDDNHDDDNDVLCLVECIAVPAILREHAEALAFFK